MALTSGYLVVYERRGERFATLYDEYLNFISELDPDSEETAEHIRHAEEVTSLDDEMWEEVLGELDSKERQQASAYRLEDEVLTNAERDIEDVMEQNDDERDSGYNG